MKKFNKVIYLVFFFCSVFFCATGVKANTQELCRYDNNSVPKRIVKILYDFEKENYRVEYYYENYGAELDAMYMGNSKLYFSSYAKKNLDNGECPKTAYLDVDANNEVCFDNSDALSNDGYCQSKKGFDFEESAYSLVDEFEEYRMKYVEKVSKNVNFRDKSCTEYTEDKETLKSLLMDEIRTQAEIETKFFPPTYKGRITEMLSDTYLNGIFNNAYTEFKNRCKTEFETQVENGNLSSEDADKKNEILEDIDMEEITEEINRVVTNFYGNSYTGRIFCGIFGVKTFGFIKTMYNFIKIVIPVLIIVLGIVDFLKVVFSGEDKDMKASGTRFLKRIIVGIIFILLPALLEFLMSIVGFSEDCLQQLIK